ncbi:MAG: DUF2750 domain-containing protein [Planctomycetes bacterium]|nr:DUF2750 domain-containing protein [Planctomycetota bacterium]
MSNAGLQWTKFREEVAASKVLYTFADRGDWLVFPVRGQGVMPFWSSRSRAQRIRDYHPDNFKGWEIIEIKLDHFLGKVLPGMKKDGLHVGSNWAGKRMVGYDHPPDEVADALQAMLQLLADKPSKEPRRGARK